jgi:CRP/FNR family transcriptional regulator, anaerobic regulatory protein
MNHRFELLRGSAPDISVPQRRGGTVERHSLADLLRLMGVDAADAPGADAYPITMRQLHAGAPLFHEGQTAEAIYFVSVGMFKTFSTAEDGYEQVLGFCGRGEVLGFDAICGGSHPTSAVALEEARVYALPMRDLFTLGNRVAALDRVVHVAASRQLAQRGEIADVMAAVAAEVRLARFLVQLSTRMEACGQSPRRFLLRMCRRDIASHLGVAHETVSRSFGALADWGYLRVNYREVEISDIGALKAFARSTRGLVDEPAGRARRRLAAVPGDSRRAPPAIAAAA